jgi:hypothetical protein
MSNIVTSLASRSNEDRTTPPSQGHSRRDDYTPITVLKDVKEGEASIFRPADGGYKLVARVQMDEWPHIAATK